MSQYFEIVGGTPLQGSVLLGGAKNAALPMLIASLLTPEKVILRNVPEIQDIEIALNLLQTFGAVVSRYKNVVELTTEKLIASEASYSLVKALRASFWVLAPLLARGGAARVSLPGGDIIGARPVDLHLSALQAMGADITLSHGTVYATAVKGLSPAHISFHVPSVGATHQVLMAASLTPGITVLEGAAREPEIVALATMLSKMGAVIEGAGSSTITIQGREELKGLDTFVIGDRLEACTYLLAGLVSKGDVLVEGIDNSFLEKPLEVLQEMEAEVITGNNFVRVKYKKPFLGATISTGPFPEFATDLQALFMATLATAQGESSIVEHVFEGRFGNVSELCRMGAHITVRENTAFIKGVASLEGARVDCLDIRAAAALVIAAVGAQGRTDIYEIHHLRRGYENLEKKLSSLGARISLRNDEASDYVFTGC
jgi:UDP-N-acetylglucosamine 1-carboxyvinyltransferase